MSGGWDENKKYVLEKIDDHDSAHEKQTNINRVQSDWNHQTESRIDKIAERQVQITIVVGAIAATVTENLGDVLNLIKGLFK